MRRAATVCVFLVPTIVGCASAPARGPLSAAHRASDEGRLRGVVSQLTAPLRDCAVRVTLDDSPSVGAYAWPDGRVLVTRGLVRLLDDDELAAAVAHELGHLLADGRVHAAAALSGAGADVEGRADAVGRGLLPPAGYAPDAMARMLEKVAASPGMSNDCRARLRGRIARLRAGS